MSPDQRPGIISGALQDTRRIFQALQNHEALEPGQVSVSVVNLGDKFFSEVNRLQMQLHKDRSDAMPTMLKVEAVWDEKRFLDELTNAVPSDGHLFVIGSLVPDGQIGVDEYENLASAFAQEKGIKVTMIFNDRNQPEPEDPGRH